MKTFKEYENIDKVCEEVIFEHELEGIQEAEYQGKKVKLNDPIRGGSKKFYRQRIVDSSTKFFQQIDMFLFP